MAWATLLARGATAANARVKKLTYEAEHRSLRDQLDAERDSVVEAIYGDECGEGLRAFVDKRPTRFVEDA